jgi:ribose 5-phosphate isomerase
MVVNEAINKSMVVGLGRGITQVDCFFFLGKKTYAKLKEVSINFTSRCQPSI